MPRVIGSSLDALERRKAKENKKYKTCSSSTGPVDPPASFHGLPSQTELLDAASLIVRTVLFSIKTRPLDRRDDGENEILTIRKNDADLVAKKEMDELPEMVSENLSLKKEFAGLKVSSGAHNSSLGKHTSWDVDKAIAEYAELCQMLGMRNMLEE
ncbi:hypothetical protein Adt_23841 [Abeliophyllum distichum]|uniref:Uncharacterized protein n=1 Tax=Abeliophyllum distichum TaxID=126358 RepID=A0ABD1SC16_9LAMI